MSYSAKRRDSAPKRKNSDPEAFDNNVECLEVIENNLEQDKPKSLGLWGIWPFNMLRDRPIFRLFLVILCNGIISNIFSTIFLNIEQPAQLVRIHIFHLVLILTQYLFIANRHLYRNNLHVLIFFA